MPVYIGLNSNTRQSSSATKDSHYHIKYYITLHYINLHYIVLHYITLHYITLHYNKFVFDLSFLFQAGFLAPFILLKARKFVLLYTMGSLFTIGRFVNTLQSIECLNCCIPPPIIEGFFRKRIFFPSTSLPSALHQNTVTLTLPLPQPTITIITQALPTLSEYTHCHHLDYYHNFES